MSSRPDSDLPLMADGFRERGAQVTRQEAFVDAAFAFALSLLVISANEIPKSIPALLLAMRGVPAFAGCFLQVAWFWHAHVRWSRRYGLDDGRSTVLSLLLVFLVLVYVYPLRILFGTFFAWISQGWFPWPIAPLHSIGELMSMFVVYGVAFATLSLTLAALYAHALRQRQALNLSIDEAAQTAGVVVAWRLSAAVGLLSILAALIITLTLQPGEGDWRLGLPGMLYFTLHFSGLVIRRTIAKARLQYQQELSP
ncbi:MAG TPA: TMEM175 family protein [Arenimonas sp.]|uniref:TMEM175 family protein n=1 Tax=Arenimonas sp. TaxID=1872635 RepID=UPI002B93E9C3|nr:TMEM175 family protein [Arenimonas sp.]HMB56830.1 TMEM175 family protein [Arenimonas sp.]